METLVILVFVIGYLAIAFEIFVPAATSRLIIKDQVDRMIASKIEVFPCAAHVPFFDPEIFLGPIGLYADEKFSVIPDFIANSGRAGRVLILWRIRCLRMTNLFLTISLARFIRRC